MNEAVKCSIDGCALENSAKGLCKKHYIKEYCKSYERPCTLLKCTVTGCMNARKTSKYCSKHSERYRKYKDVGFTMLPRGKHNIPYLRNIWRGMVDRCYNTANKSYCHYGGRGISVCERWRKSFDSFFIDIGERPSPDYSIDRIDNDGDYEPSNCRWATRSVQAHNIRPRSITGHKNVYLIIPSGEYAVSMDKDKVRFYGGRFNTLEEAIVCRQELEKKLYGEPMSLKGLRQCQPIA